MLSLTESLHDELIYKHQQLTLDLSFDVILLWFDLLESDLTEEEKIQQGFDNVVQSTTLFSLEEKTEILQQAMDYVLEPTYGQIKEDTINKQSMMKETRFFSYTRDAGAIFASFYKEYRIDLVEERGKLPYLKFAALLDGLSDESYFRRIIKIRKANPADYEGEALSELIQAQQFYALDEKVTTANLTKQMGNMFDLVAAKVKEGE
ncbi:bacteriophage Gp15 family protein [Melissococcus plutonius]|uniref:bacteriophage Gp15 family protein n=1 Tax=Melissococcus plutonius TaxID=33970 RepID=UPI0021E5F047|nr:bacteriophage Gp15 family protein [Melissococcus plutonius]MCV2505650.1 bacteriophage Gp15 family protein [Melissococcus plutonius]